MRSILKLESIGDNLQAVSCAIDGGNVLGGRALGGLRGKMWCYALSPPKRPWVARILGTDSRWGYQREFLRGTKDYSEANSTASRGVYYWFTLDDGLYQVFEHLSWKHQRRYFAEARDGQIEEIAEEDLKWRLTSRSQSARMFSPPPASESPGPSRVSTSASP